MHIWRPLWVQAEFSEIRALQMVNLEEHIPVEPHKRDDFRQRVAEDADIQELDRVIKQCWSYKKKCFPAVQPYYNERGELIESHGLVFRGEQLAVPFTLRKDLLNQLHSSHIDIGECILRVREILNRPRMRDFVQSAKHTDQNRLLKSFNCTRAPVTPLAKDCRRSVCPWSTDISDDSGSLVQFL